MRYVRDFTVCLKSDKFVFIRASHFVLDNGFIKFYRGNELVSVVCDEVINLIMEG